VTVLRKSGSEKKVDKCQQGADADLNRAIEGLQSVETHTLPFGANLVKPASLHDENGSLLWMSATASRLLGISSQGFVADTADTQFLDAIHVQDRVKTAHFLAERTGHEEHQNTGSHCEFRRKDAGRKPGEPQWIEIEKTGFAGQVHGRRMVLLTYRDITNVKNNELNALLLKQKTEEADLAKSRFLANISHELRTPLNAILGFSELLNSPIITTFSEEKKNDYVSLIHDSAKHLLALLNSILDMSKIENGMYEIFPESFCLRTSLENTTAIMRGQSDLRSISVQTSGFDELPDIVADERAIRQIMINLLSNAIKFSNDGDSVRVSASRMARTVEICVEDNGVGISDDHLADLGTPFFQADSKYDRKYEGTGLGLSIVRGLVDLHHGTVRFESRRGHGTKVTVRIPIHGRTGRQVPSRQDDHLVISINPEVEETAPGLRIIRDTA